MQPAPAQRCHRQQEEQPLCSLGEGFWGEQARLQPGGDVLFGGGSAGLGGGAAGQQQQATEGESARHGAADACLRVAGRLLKRERAEGRR